MDTIIKKLMENRLHEEVDEMFDEDLKRYKGKPMKELLTALDGKVRLDIRMERPNVYGVHGFGGMAKQVTWCYADMIIKDIAAGDRKYVDVYVKL